MSVIRLTDEQRRVYLVLREGCAQSLVVKRTGIRKGTVSKIASRFVKGGFLERVTKVQPYMYGEGPRSRELDQFIAFRQVSTSTAGEVSTNATSVKQVSSQTSRISTVRAHHTKVRFLVEKIGDMETLQLPGGAVSFLEKSPYFDYRSIKKTKGRFVHPQGVCSVELEEGPSKTWFYIHLPEHQLTKEQIPEWEEICSAVAQDVANTLQKRGGWRFGLMEFCNKWKVHYEAEDKRIANDLLEQIHAKSHDGSVWTSDSEGRRELETSNPEYAQIIVSMPEAIYELKLEMRELVEITGLIKVAVENLARAEALETEERVAAAGMGK